MKHLTKRQALEYCHDLWRFLADHPNANTESVSHAKDQWPGMAEHGPFISNCPCCHYAAVPAKGAPENHDIDCSQCPLLGLWPFEGHQASEPINECPCLNDSSPYEAYTNALADGDKRACVLWAKVIADAAQAELEKEGK